MNSQIQANSRFIQGGKVLKSSFSQPKNGNSSYVKLIYEKRSNMGDSGDLSMEVITNYLKSNINLESFTMRLIR